MCCLPSLSMGPEIQPDDKMKASSTYGANRIFDKELQNERVKFTSNYQGIRADAHLVDQTEEVNITEATNSSGDELQNSVEAEYFDTTDSSSSFDDCDYSEPLYRHGDDEWDLNFGFDEVFRLTKKRLAIEWRSFVQPLRWRCKWVELQIKKLEEQGRIYDVQLERYSQQKQVLLEKSTLEGIGVKSLPLSQNYGGKNEVRRRKKRRRAEATENPLTYMLHHNLFAYHEGKKPLDQGASNEHKLRASNEDKLRNREANQKVDVDDKFWGDDQSSCIENGNDDNSLEQIFRKIDFLQSRVSKLTSRVGKVISETDGKLAEKVISEKDGELTEQTTTSENHGKLPENVTSENNGKLAEKVISENNGKLVEKVTSEKVGKSSSSDRPSLPISDNALVSSPLNNVDSPNYGRSMSMGDLIAYQLIKGYMSDNPEIGVKSPGEFVSDANGSIDLDYFASLFGNEDEDVLIDNHRAKEEMRNFEELIRPIQKSPILAKPDQPTDDQRPQKLQSNMPTDDQRPQKLRSIALPMDDQTPKRKRSIPGVAASRSKSKRGRRRGGRPL